MDSQQLNQLRQAAMDMMEMMSVLTDTVDGYRIQLEERGYSPTAAETMAVQFHAHLLAVARSGGGSDG